MPRYTIVRPAFTRVEEVYYIEADSEEEALEIADSAEVDDYIDDPDYYEPYGRFEVAEVEE